MSYLRIDNVSKAFGKKRILHRLSLDLQRGECMAVFGGSGCGKTTLLRLIAGIMEPDEGDILIDAKVVTQTGPEARGVAMAFQNFALYPHLDAFENIASPLRARRISDEQIKKRVHDVAAMLRIEHVLDHTPRQLSNGQKQRTSLARSLVHAPTVLLLDDPLRNVDAKIRYEMRLELPRLLKEFGSTVIYVTQDYREALALGGRIGVMVDGNFKQVDSPAGVYERPASREIARLFGDPPINLFAVTPSRKPGGGLSVKLGNHDVDLPAQHHLLENRDCLMGVRPEDLRFSFEPLAGGVPVTLEAVMPMNVRSVALLKAADSSEMLSSRPEDAALNAVRGRHEGWAAVDFSRVHFFDRASGLRI